MIKRKATNKLNKPIVEMGNPSNPQLRTESVGTNPQSQRKSPQTQPGKRRTTRKEGKGRHGGNR